nr:putative transposase En/Spm [Ipomoea batatas]
MNWWVVLNVRPRGAIDSAYISSYTYQQDNALLPTYGCDQSIQDDVQVLVHESLQMNEVELPQSENQWSNQGVQTEDSEEEGTEEIEEYDTDDSVEDDRVSNDDYVENDCGDLDGKEVFADELNKATNALESLLNETKDKAVKYSTADEKPALRRAKSEDEATIRKIYEKSAAKRLSDTLSQVRANLREGKSPPKWMSDAVLAQYKTLWDNADFKRLSEKNKKNRNSDCGGMGPSLHTGGSIPMTEHKRRLEIVTQKHQTQPELDQSIVRYEATGGLKKGGYVFGFGSDTQHYFPEVATQKMSTYGGSSSHVACDERIGQLEKTKDEILEQNKIIIELLRRAHPELLQSIAHAVDSNQGSDIGLDNLNVNDDTQSPV